MPADPRSLKELFLAALAVAPAERTAWLERECADDAERRRHVELMLAAHDRPQSLFDHAAPVAAPLRDTIGAAATLESGAVIGPYTLLEQIGEGGFGVVYLAEQTEPVRRKVALKILKPGMDTRQVVTRFEVERQALAIMDHPNIAKVFDGGSTGEPRTIVSGGEIVSAGEPESLTIVRGSARPYFVMELVKGVPITDFCDQNQLTPRQRLELFIPVCQAVQHAHQKGVIHRDLKPSNILVTVHDPPSPPLAKGGHVGVPKIIDFGIAKALGQELTDKTLFTGFAQIVGTPLYMSPEQAGQNGLDIDTRSDIYSLGVLLYELLTGTTPFTKERFQQAPYDEIRRIIRDEDPPKPSTRLSDLRRPHAPREDTVTRSVTSTLASISAQRQTEPAKLTKLVRGELDWIVMKALEKDRNRRYETANGLAMDVQRYLADEPVHAGPPSALYRFRKFARRNKGALAIAACVLLAAATLVGSVGWIVGDRTARLKDTESQVDHALREATQAARQRAWPAARLAVTRAQGLLSTGRAGREWQARVAELAADLDAVAELEELRLRASDVQGEFFDLGRADREYGQVFRGFGIDVEALDAGDAAALIQRRPVGAELAVALDDWARARWLIGRADRSWKQLLDVARRADPNPYRNGLRDAWESGDFNALKSLARDRTTVKQPAPSVLLLADVLAGSGDAALAVEVLIQAQRLHPDDFWINHNLAYYLEDRLKPARAAEAVAFYRAALALRPDSPGAHLNLGVALLALENWSEAEAEFRRAIELKPEYAKAHNNLGAVLLEQGAIDGAIDAFREAIRHQPDFAGAHRHLGIALWHKGATDAALEAYHQAIRLKPDYAEAHVRLGNALLKMRKIDAAIDACREAIRHKPGYAEAHVTLGNALRRKGEIDAAIDACREAVRLKSDYAEAHVSLGNALLDKGAIDRGALDEAIAAYREAVRLKPNYAHAHYSLGIALGQKGSRHEAVAAYREAIRLNPEDAEFHNNLGILLRQTGAFGEAIAAFREAIRCQPTLAFAHANLARVLANCPDPKFRDGERALESAKKAVELAPEHGTCYTVLGIALYRAGDWKASRAAMEKSCRLRKGGNSFEWFVLALAHGRLGEHDEARRWYERAVAWMEKNQPNNEELRRFRTEAAELMKKESGVRNQESAKQPMRD